MSVEDFIPSESPESGWNSAEISETYRQAAKKAQAGIQRTQKDEKKAKKYDFLLANFLVEMILAKKYDSVLDELFACFDAGYGTNFLLGIVSLIYTPISDEIRKQAGKSPIVFGYVPTEHPLEFAPDALPPDIRKRVNYWIEDMETVMRLEVSAMITKRTLWLMLYDEKVRTFTKEIFLFFFRENNITISDSTAKNYVEFILGELQKSTKKITQDLEHEQP